MTAAHTPTLPTESPGWTMPGTLVLRLMLVAVLAVALSGILAAWVVTRASSQEAMRRVVGQQTEEVEVVARLLASKIEQSQKVLRTVAGGITPVTLASPSSLEWLLQQGLPAVQFFDTMQVARDNGELSLNLRGGRIHDATEVDPAERDVLRRTLVRREVRRRPRGVHLRHEFSAAHHRRAARTHQLQHPGGDAIEIRNGVTGRILHGHALPLHQRGHFVFERAPSAVDAQRPCLWPLGPRTGFDGVLNANRQPGTRNEREHAT